MNVSISLTLSESDFSALCASGGTKKSANLTQPHDRSTRRSVGFAKKYKTEHTVPGVKTIAIIAPISGEEDEDVFGASVNDAATHVFDALEHVNPAAHCESLVHSTHVPELNVLPVRHDVHAEEPKPEHVAHELEHESQEPELLRYSPEGQEQLSTSQHLYVALIAQQYSEFARTHEDESFSS